MRGIERIVRGRLHYGWIVAGVTFLTLLASAGIRSTPGILIIPLEKEFGWTRATVSFADRKSTRLNSSHGYISYAVFCLKKKKTHPAHASHELPSPDYNTGHL